MYALGKNQGHDGCMRQATLRRPWNTSSVGDHELQRRLIEKEALSGEQVDTLLLLVRTIGHVSRLSTRILADGRHVRGIIVGKLDRSIHNEQQAGIFLIVEGVRQTEKEMRR